MEITIDKFIKIGLELVYEFGPKIIGGFVCLIIGYWLANKISKIVKANLQKSNFSLEISSFLLSILDVSLKIAVILIAAGIFGFDTSALVGMLAAAGFAVGLALQGGLGNFASGILILIFKPYKVGDWINLNDKFGKVEEIQIFNTILITPGHKTLIIPNAQITSNIITNFSKNGIVRIELEAFLSYEESFGPIKIALENALSLNNKILKEPKPEVGIVSFDDSKIRIAVRPYVKPDDYWAVSFETNKIIKEVFANNKVKAVYPNGLSLGEIIE